MMKQLSDSFASDAVKAERALRYGDSVDKHVDSELVLETMTSLEKKYSIDLERASSED